MAIELILIIIIRRRKKYHKKMTLLFFFVFGRVVSEKNERFSYYTSVGVNSYITAQLSFLPERETRCTRIVARTFSPEFDHYMEMSCDLLLQRSTGETCSLAEQLEQASAIFTVWNRESREGSSEIYKKTFYTVSCICKFLIFTFV